MNRKLSLTTVLTSLVLVLNPVIALAEKPLTPYQIMDKANSIDMGDSSSSHMIMTITNEKGEKKVTELDSFRKNFGDNNSETRNIMFYSAPITLKNVGFLSIDYKDPKKNDERWMYSPAIKKIKKVATHDKRLAFMNSDFSYADMTVRDSDNYIFFSSMKEDTIDGNKVWVIEGTPIREEEVGDDGYSKSIFYVRKDNFMLVRAVNVLKQGGKEKQMDISDIKQVEGYWVMGNIKMTTRKAGKVLSTTTLANTETHFNQDFKESFFTERQLELGGI